MMDGRVKITVKEYAVAFWARVAAGDDTIMERTSNPAIDTVGLTFISFAQTGNP